MVGTAVAGGPDRANKAADMAVACPQLEGIDRSGARGVLVVAATNRMRATVNVNALASNGVAEIEIPAFLRKQADCGADRAIKRGHCSALFLLSWWLYRPESDVDDWRLPGASWGYPARPELRRLIEDDRRHHRSTGDQAHS